MLSYVAERINRVYRLYKEIYSWTLYLSYMTVKRESESW